MHRARLGCLGGLLFFFVACGGTAQSGFDGGDGKDGGGGGGGHDATMHGKDSGGIHLVPDGGTSSDGPKCQGLQCSVANCGSGDTTVSGYVYAPNGELPLYDVQVFIPNAPLDPLPKGVQCENCGTPLSGSPITTALSDPMGHFTLTGVPSGTDIPIVVQLGKWRRQTVIPKVSACVTTTLTDPNLTRLPKNQMEGNMPHVALTTGGCDQMGCMLPKMGIDPMEFGSQADGYNKAIHVYNGSGGGAGLGATAALNLWGNATNLATYDEAIFSCECYEAPDSKGGGFGAASYGIVTDYLNAGGRIFTTDFQYVWYKYSPDPNLGGPGGSSSTGIGSIIGGAPGGGNPMILSTAIPKAVALSAWLKNIFSGVPLPSGTTYPLDTHAQMNEVYADYVFSNIQSVDPTKTVDWADSPSPMGPRVFTVDTPVGVATDKQCGRGVHIDVHVDQDQTVGPTYPAGCKPTLKADEAAFAFFFFDLSSCISDNHKPPKPPPPVK